MSSHETVPPVPGSNLPAAIMPMTSKGSPRRTWSPVPRLSGWHSRSPDVRGRVIDKKHDRVTISGPTPASAATGHDVQQSPA